jgi:archaeal flagellar protein FlaI
MSPNIVIRPTGGQRRPLAKNPLRGMDQIIEECSRRRPFFSSCWIAQSLPGRYELLDEYSCTDAEVRIVSTSQSMCPLYHLLPWEYSIPDVWVSLIRGTIEWISVNPPLSPTDSLNELRQYVVTMAKRRIAHQAEKLGINLSQGPSQRSEILSRLSEVVGRYTVGLGVFEILLQDPRIEDIFIDAPASDNMVHVNLSNIASMNEMFKCETNIIASEREVEGLVSRLRHYSKKPFSEAFPIMETDMPSFGARATVIGPPLSPQGTAVALRRRSKNPWTMPGLIANGTLDSWTAGLISFLMDGRSTILVAGARGSGKSTLLSAMLFEFPQNQRILVIEDTQELPVARLQSLSYDIQSLLVEQRPGEDRETKTDEALRVSLRLGESAIILGEVRGKEAQTLYQSMRTGRAGSAVMGTIHGENAASVYERVVHDMGIPGEAFMATDVVMTMSLHRPHGSQKQVRKLTEVAECARLRGAGQFNILGNFAPSVEGMVHEREGSETIARIAKAWNMTYDDAMKNIGARAELRETLVRIAKERGMEYLGSTWVTRANTFFWRYMEQGRGDYGMLVNDFDSWMRERVGAGLE